MAKFTATFLDSQNKGELRALCRDHGIAYGGLNVPGMKLALESVPEGDEQPVAAEVVQEVAPTDVVPAELVQAPEPTEVAVVVREPRVLPTLTAPVAPVKAEKVRKIQANRPEQHGVKRPSEGTICAQIWGYCDATMAGGQMPTAKALRADLAELDDTTKTVQYYRWRKFNGIAGRS